MSEYFINTLENGIRLVTVPMPQLHAAELVCYLAVGGRNEPAEFSGISHFLEHMIFRGTAEYATSTDLERAFEAIGGAVNASTDAETTCFHSRIHPDYLADGLALFASMLRRPLFNDIDVERRIILEEAREDYNEKEVQINLDNLMVNLLWPGHPLGDSLIGTPETLARIDRTALEDYYRNWYLPQNLVICACGRIKQDQLLEQVEREFGDWAPQPLQKAEPAPVVDSSVPKCCWVADSDSQISVQLAFPLAGRRDERTLALRVLRRLLSWGGGARLPLRLREQLGLTYAVEANCSMLDDTGYLVIDLAVAPENLQQSLAELLQVLQELREQPVPDEELEATVRGYLFDLDFSRDQTEALAVRYGWGLQANYLRTLEQDRSELQQITADQLQQVAAEVLRPEALKLVVVGPWTAADRAAVERLIGC
ncbi:pitrilysin family protein [Malonomonas rubra]|uniref:M16 family metallopeptidase n=1 Tax=Malonomonas rubra TaxID=57040 RepID=UPI0026F141CA|nr:pitrilysin family protein [Malonomonas rubra]